MAFNPFDIFRRNQKTFFIVLTAFVMVMFVLSFGQGDFFQWLPKWLNQKTQAGQTTLAVVDGQKFTGADLTQYDNGRILANQFMATSSQIAARNLVKQIEDGLPGASDAGKETFRRLLSSRQMNYIDPQMMQMLQQFGSQMPADRLNSIIMQSRSSNLDRLQQSLRSMTADTVTQNKDDVELANAARELISLDNSISQMQQTGFGYFSNLPYGANPERFEFGLWLRKADQLGITLTEKDAIELYSRELGGKIRDEDWEEIETGFRARYAGAYTRDKLLAALRDEFKVRAAMSVVLGPVVGRSGSEAVQSFETPYDTYADYKRLCDAATFAMISVPVENFVDKVSGTPTESELQILFDKYRKIEPNPVQEEPGLKEPRKLKISWLEVTGEESYYVKAAEKSLQTGDAAFRLLPLAVPGIGGPITTVVVENLTDGSLASAYEAYRVRNMNDTDGKWFPTAFAPQVHSVTDRAALQPANLLVAIGAAAGSAVTHASALTMPLVLVERAKTEDRNMRARVFASMLVPSSVSGTGLLGNTLAAGARMPQPLPISVVKAELLTEVKTAATRAQAEADLRIFQTELAKLGARKDKDKSEAKAYLEKFVAERALKTGGSTEFRDRFHLDDDAGLAPLGVKLAKSQPASDVPLKFGPSFFVEPDPNGNPLDRNPRMVNAQTFYNPKPFPETGLGSVNLQPNESSFLTWRTDEQPALEPRELGKIRDKVVAVWKHLKARELAKQAAEDLKKQIDKTLADEHAIGQTGKIDRIVRDLQTKFVVEQFKTPEALSRASYFLLNGVSPIVSQNRSFDARGSGLGQPFQLTPRKEMQYPTLEMQTELLKTKDEPLGTTLVMTDRPKDIYYVGVLQNRDERTSGSFYTEVYNGAPGDLGQAVWQRSMGESLSQARQQAIALLKAEFHVTDESPKLADASRDSSIE